MEDNIGLVRLSSFQKRSADHIADAIKKIKDDLKRKKTYLGGLIIDLRSNPGGLLDEAVNVSSLFLKSGVVVSTESRDPKNKEIRSSLHSSSKIL